MSAEIHDQFVFGSHAANAHDGPPGRATATSATRVQTTVSLSEVPADDELSTLCTTVAEAMPTAVRTAVVIVAPPRPAPRPVLTATAVATSSPSTTAVLRIEWLLREGPVRASLASGEPTVSGRLGEDPRWPRFARAVPAHDTVSAAAVPVPLDARVGSGVLAAYSQEEAAFGPGDLRVLAAFARVVGGLVAREARTTPSPEAEEQETLRLVNQAIGVLISHRCDEEQAMRRLRSISRSTGQTLAAAAQLIVTEAQVEARLRSVAPSLPQADQPR